MAVLAVAAGLFLMFMFRFRDGYGNRFAVSYFGDGQFHVDPEFSLHFLCRYPQMGIAHAERMVSPVPSYVYFERRVFFRQSR